MILTTFSTCFYILHSKFPPEKYIEWMTNFLSIVNNFYLVIYTDEATRPHIPVDIDVDKRIQIVLKPLDQLYNYKYKDMWIQNHAQNVYLNDRTCWELNMLWAEKIHFVKETIERNYFNTEYHGWCDIGYFRDRPMEDTPTSQLALMGWPCREKIEQLPKDKIVYACVNNNDFIMNDLVQTVKRKNTWGLPMIPIHPTQVSIAGGFFVLHRTKIHWWFATFDQTLANYFRHGYLVKDDQIILADCIFSEPNHFSLYREYEPPLDNWFMFQRIFCSP